MNVLLAREEYQGEGTIGLRAKPAPRMQISLFENVKKTLRPARPILTDSMIREAPKSKQRSATELASGYRPLASVHKPVASD